MRSRTEDGAAPTSARARVGRWTCFGLVAGACLPVGWIAGGGCFFAIEAIFDSYPNEPPFAWVPALLASCAVGAIVAGVAGAWMLHRRLSPLHRARRGDAA